MKKLFYSFVALCFAIGTQAQVVTFENVETFEGELTLNADNYQRNFMDEDEIEGYFISGGFSFPNYCMEDWDFYCGFAISARTDTTFESTNPDQFNSCVGHGVNNSSNYAVYYDASSMMPPMYILNLRKTDQVVSGFYLTNTAWVTKSILNGDGFGGPFETGDFLKLTITGTNSSDESKTVEVFLADYTSENAADHYYLKDWTWVDLSALGAISRISFVIDGSRKNDWGLTTPTYFCMDDFNGKAPQAGQSGAATFEDLTLEPESFWNGTDGTGSFTSGGYKFENGYQDYDGYPYCYGFYYTNRTATTYGGYAPTDQYNSAVGHGAEGSANYATYNVNDYDPKGVEVLEDAHVINGCYLTNNAYAYLSMLNGENNTKKFAQGDWFKLTITGLDTKGEKTGTVDFYLADLRSENEADHYILNDWQWCDLTSLGEVKRLAFTMSSTDNGDWGMNTPAYFCMDNLGGEKPTTVGISPVQNVKQGTAVRFGLNGQQLNAAKKGINIVRMPDGTVRKVVIK